MVYMTEILKKLNEIQRKLQVPKNQKNDFGNYKYRSCEDIVEAIKKLLGDDAALHLTDEIVEIAGRIYVKATASLIMDDEVNKAIHSTGYAREEETKKGMDQSQITGAASSYARKYALNGLFAIDDTKDADTKDNNEVKKPVSKGPIIEKTVEAPKADKFGDDVKVPNVCSKCGTDKISDQVKNFSIDKYKKVLCFDCQADERVRIANESNNNK